MRNDKMIKLLIFFGSIFIIVLLFQIYNRRSYPEMSDSLKSIISKAGNYNEKTCIMFLKAHKCASSTVQNILMRFGYKRGLDFVLPLTNNYIGNPKPFQSSFIPLELTSSSRKYHMFTHHTRYNYTAMKLVMQPDCKFVTILREPASLYESLFNFYHLERTTNLSLQEVIKSKEKWPSLKKKRMLNRIGVNQMAWDLGYNYADNVDLFLNKIDKEFDLVMLSEYMEVSLVMLAKLMQWPLENVVSLKLNSRQSGRMKKLTEEERDSLIELNSIDAELYDYFSDKFFKSIIKYGKQKLKNDVNKLLELNSNLRKNCVDKLNNKGYAQTSNYDIRNNLDFTCVYSAKTELPFTEEIRNDQKERFRVKKELETLLEYGVV